jgi:hypothetical protein
MCQVERQGPEPWPLQLRPALRAVPHAPSHPRPASRCPAHRSMPLDLRVTIAWALPCSSVATALILGMASPGQVCLEMNRRGWVQRDTGAVGAAAATAAPAPVISTFPVCARRDAKRDHD